MQIRPVIMSGGAGTRLWPLSRKSHPKQFHALGGDHTLFQQTVQRTTGEGFLAPIVLAAEAHQSLINDEFAAIGVEPEALILEPMARNTAPAIAALAVARDAVASDEIVIILPADHIIDDAAHFRESIRNGAAQAAAGKIVTFGIEPTAPETGYGYIRAGVSSMTLCSRSQASKKSQILKPRNHTLRLATIPGMRACSCSGQT